MLRDALTRRAAALVVTTVAASTVAVGAASAAGFTAIGTGVGSSRASQLPAGHRPTAAISGTSVTLSWPPAMLASGNDVGGYVVQRTVVATGAGATACTVTAPITTCTDTPPSGQAVIYTVAPTAGPWRGPTSPASASVTLP